MTYLQGIFWSLCEVYAIKCRLLLSNQNGICWFITWFCKAFQNFHLWLLFLIKNNDVLGYNVSNNPVNTFITQSDTWYAIDCKKLYSVNLVQVYFSFNYWHCWVCQILHFWNINLYFSFFISPDKSKDLLVIPLLLSKGFNFRKYWNLPWILLLWRLRWKS